jgi:hypothetical protein
MVRSLGSISCVGKNKIASTKGEKDSNLTPTNVLRQRGRVGCVGQGIKADRWLLHIGAVLDNDFRQNIAVFNNASRDLRVLHGVKVQLPFKYLE